MSQAEEGSKPEASPAANAPKPTPASSPNKNLAEPNTNNTEDQPSSQLNTAEDDDELSPPPENSPSPAPPISPIRHRSPTPADEQASDEIVVSSNRNAADKPSPLRVVSDPEDEAMPDAPDDNDDDDEDEADEADRQATPYPKRKRMSTFADLNEDELGNEVFTATDGQPAVARSKQPMRRQGPGAANNPSVVLGYWRDSPVADDAGKHAVIGFIDVRDRLRTRIQTFTRTRNSVKAPVPPGPGGLWVTFERIVFEPHLVGLNHYQVKEFVKLRAGAADDDNTPEAQRDANLAAVEEAKRRVDDNPPPDAAPAPAIAYGPTLPDDAVISASAKRRRHASGVSTILGASTLAAHPAPSPSISRPADPRRVLPSARGQSGNSQSSSQQQQQQQQQQQAQNVPVLGALPGTRPTRIVVGYWKPSDAPDPRNRHAVLGILGQNDNFRVKVIRETRDGRFIDGNFPTGAGALWIQWSEMELEPHIKHLTRTELKEYVRVRQYQIDRGETALERVQNEEHAVYVAQRRALHAVRTGSLPAGAQAAGPVEDEAAAVDDADIAEPAGARLDGRRSSVGGQESRASSHRRQDLPAARHSLPNLESRQSSRTPTTTAAAAAAAARRETIDLHARREMGRLEQYERSRALSNAERDAAIEQPTATAMAATTAARTGFANGFHSRDEMMQLDDIWQRQEGQRNRANTDNVKYYGGTKYERKATGPFAGKLVSQGVIISIDGDDYVEYRVLTKPSFF